MNACDTSSHGDILMCQIIIMSTDKKVVAQARSHEKKPTIQLTLRSTVNAVSVTRMYTTHRLMVIPMCQTFYANIKAKGIYEKTRRCTEKVKDRVS